MAHLDSIKSEIQRSRVHYPLGAQEKLVFFKVETDVLLECCTPVCMYMLEKITYAHERSWSPCQSSLDSHKCHMHV